MENIRILLDLFPASIAAGVMIASVCALLGVYVILKRMVFIGVALSEAAALGIAFGMVFGFPAFAGSAILTLAFGLGLSRPYESGRLPREAMLGLLFAMASALSILLVSKAGLGLEEIKALLYGDLILTRPGDLWMGLTVFLPIVAGLILFWRPVLYTFLDREAARILGIATSLWEVLFFAALSLAVAASARVAGAMLVFAYLIVAPAAALLVSRRLLRAMLTAVAVAVGSTLAGLYGALVFDLPANQLIVALMSLCCFGAGAIRGFARWSRPVGTRPP